MSQIQLNYGVPLFWSIFGEIHWKILFLFKKLTLRMKLRNIQKVYFSQQVWKGEKPEENLDLF